MHHMYETVVYVACVLIAIAAIGVFIIFPIGFILLVLIRWVIEVIRGSNVS